MTSPPDYQNTPRQPEASLGHPEILISQTNGPSLPPESSRSRETVLRSALKTSGSLPNESGLQDQGDDTPTSQSSSFSTSPPESLQESRQRIQIGSPPSLTEGPPGLPTDTRRRLTSRGGSADLRDTSSERLEERFGVAVESPTNVTGGKSTVNLQEESTLLPHTSPQAQHTSDYVPPKNEPTALQDTSGSPQEVKSSHGSSTTLNEPSKPLATPPQGQTHPRGLARHPAKAIIQPPSALRSSGTRTPRKGKVQWGHSDEPEISEFGRTHHMLDEKGLDHERFRELTKALERHSAATPLRKVHVYSPQSSSPASLEESSGSGLSSRDDTDFFSSSNAATLPLPQTTHEVPENLIGEDEDGGLPGTKDLRRFSLKKAEDVVRARLHRKPGWLPSKSRSRHRQLVEPLPQREVDVDDADFTDVEGPEAGAAFPGNRGILSTLLDLYQHPEDNMSSASSAPSRTSSSDRLWNRAWNQSSSSDFSRFIPRGPRLNPPALPKNGPRGFHIPSLKQLPEKLGITTRPAAARSAGGVFGPLIASTGNLTGVAAPYSSRLQPNFKRPGYGLSRYEIETKPPPGPKRGSEGVSTTPPPSLDEIGRSSSSESMFRLRSPADRYYAHKRPGMRSGYNTPRPGSPVGEDEKRPPASSPFYRRNKRRKAEVFITRHVAQIIFREEFIMKLTRAMMMFGGPPHRLQSQIMSAARVLDMQLSALYLPDVVLLSFDDSGTGTSHIKFIRQGSALNIEKLTDAFRLYWKVIHDKLSVCDASVSLDVLMKKKPSYGAWHQIFIGGMCSASICTVSFGGSFVDALVSFPLGALLVVMQMISFRNVLFSYTFEVIATLTFSFISAALAATHKLCYSALTSSSVVLILPGFLVLTGALELMSRNIVPGSVRLLYSVVYALFLGFGFSIGAEFYELFTSHQVYGAEDYTCSLTHNPLGPWYQRTPSTWWAFLTVPMFSFFLSMRNQCPWWRKEMLLLVAIACVGWVTNYWTGRRFKGQSDIIAGVGAFAVGLISNAYARIFSGNAFVVMITGILFQLPSGLGSGGLLSYASQEAQGSAESYVSGFRTALKLVSVSIGLTIGLGLSLVLTHPIQSRKREAGIFSL